MSVSKYSNASHPIQTTYTYQNNVFPNTETTAGVTKSYTFDIFGNKKSEKDGNNNTTSYTYDKLGRVLTITHPDLSTISDVYNDTTNVKIETNEIGKKTETDYNGLGYALTIKDITSSTNPVTLHTYHYDYLMRVDQETDAKNTSTVYTYDFMDRMLTKSIGSTLYNESYLYEDTQSSSYSRITKTIMGETNAPSIVTVSYNNIYGFTEKTGRIINGAEQLTVFTFDYLGNQLTSKTQDSITTSFQYDGANRLTKTTNPDNSVYQQSYDWLGEKITSTDPKSAVTNYTYYDLGYLHTVVAPFSGSYTTTKEYFYDNNGNLKSETQTNNVPGDTQTKSQTDYEYNNRNFLTKTSFYNKGAVENYVSYTYDANNNLLTKTDRLGNITTNVYDLLNRLTSVTVKKSNGTAVTENMAYSYYKTGAKEQDKNENLTTDYVYATDIIGLN